MIKNAIAFFLLLCMLACKNGADHVQAIDTSAAVKIATANNDTLFVNKRCVVYIEPDSLRIEQQKKRVGEENFYIGADDNMYYMHEASIFIDSTGMPALDARNKKIIKFMRSNQTYELININQLAELWAVYFFDPAKSPHDADVLNIAEEFRNYFHPSSTSH